MFLRGDAITTRRPTCATSPNALRARNAFGDARATRRCRERRRPAGAKRAGRAKGVAKRAGKRRAEPTAWQRARRRAASLGTCSSQTRCRRMRCFDKKRKEEEKRAAQRSRAADDWRLSRCLLAPNASTGFAGAAAAGAGAANGSALLPKGSPPKPNADDEDAAAGAANGAAAGLANASNALNAVVEAGATAATGAANASKLSPPAPKRSPLVDGTDVALLASPKGSLDELAKALPEKKKQTKQTEQTQNENAQRKEKDNDARNICRASHRRCQTGRVRRVWPQC